MHRTLYDVLTATVDSHPDKLALIAGPHRLTYRDLAERVAGLAGRLQADGVRPGDRVVICAGTGSRR